MLTDEQSSGGNRIYETTAFALLGPTRTGPWGDPAFTPLTLARLRENSRPSWVLSDLPLAVEEPILSQPLVILPSHPDRIFADLLLVIGAVLVADADLLSVLEEHGLDVGGSEVALDEAPPAAVDAAVRHAVAGTVRMTLAVPNASSLTTAIPSLSAYGLELTTLTE